MGWSTKWRITFISKIGRTYTADILVDGYTGSVIPLRGATNPFETRENNTEEYFAPIRTQTGYLRILDNGKDLNGNDFNWRDMMPSNDMQHQVRLIYNNNVLWIGYIKAELFTTRTFEYATEYSFPLICPLSLIERLPLSFNSYNGTLLTTVEILSLALSATGVSWNYVDISNNVQNWKDLNARINLMNFTNVDPTVNYVTEIATWTDKSSFYDVISQICKYWGWTIYSRGLNVYIVAKNENNIDMNVLFFIVLYLKLLIYILHVVKLIEYSFCVGDTDETAIRVIFVISTTTITRIVLCDTNKWNIFINIHKCSNGIIKEFTTLLFGQRFFHRCIVCYPYE